MEQMFLQSFWEEPVLLTPWFWTPGLQNRGRTHFCCCKPSGMRSVVTAAPGDENSSPNRKATKPRGTIGPGSWVESSEAGLGPGSPFRAWDKALSILTSDNCPIKGTFSSPHPLTIHTWQDRSLQTS